VKAAIFHPSARAAIRLFPEDVRKEIGKAIFDLQRGEILTMPLSRSMNSVAPGVSELRIRDRSGSFRVLYWMRSLRGILVFHAFLKKSQTTPKHEMELGRRRLKELIDEEI
jgi:phage-related protein